MKAALLATLVLSALVPITACDVDSDARERVPLPPKADAPSGSCADACGEQSHDGACWCDSQCSSYGDCCADKARVCDGAAACEVYPIHLDAKPGAETAARRSLAALDPAATLTWNEARGTLSGVTLDVALPGCTGTADVYDSLWKLATARPALFQMDRAEWRKPTPFPCDSVTTSNRILPVQRVAIGSQQIIQDVVSFSVYRAGTTVRLRSVFGAYVPPVPAAVAQQMTSCETLTPAVARTTVLASSFSYSAFDSCVLVSEPTYVPNQGDTVELDPTPFWLWTEDPGSKRVVLNKYQTGRLIVAPANYTSELQSSDAKCPNAPPATGFQIGFQLTFDAVTHALMGSRPGLGCLVC